MANQGWPNYTGDGDHTPSTARQSGRGSEVGAFDDFAHGSTVAHPTGGDCDPLSKRSDLFEPTGQLSTSDGPYRGV